MMEEKEVVLKALEKVDKWYVQLAGIKGDELLIVSQKEVPKEIEVEGRKLTIKHYFPEEYLTVITKDENEFRSYHVYYFVKMYMRKVLDLLAYLEVNRIRIDERDLL